MFEWDKHKDKLNQEKHGIAFSDTFAVFEDTNALTIDDDEPSEERYNTIGMDCLAEFLLWSTHGAMTTFESYRPEKLQDRR